MNDSEKLIIALAQMHSEAGACEANFEKISQMTREAAEAGACEANFEKISQMTREAAEAGAALVCFPELAYCGYWLGCEAAKNAAVTADRFTGLLGGLARENRIAVICGYAERDPETEKIYNSCLFVDAEGNRIGNTRKVYLWGKENRIFEPGHRFSVFDTEFGKIGILICYDAEFPEPARIEALKGAEILIVPAAWSIPAQRRWYLDIHANALFNLAFVAGVNTVDDRCCGRSRIATPFGEELACASADREELRIAELDMSMLAEARAKIPYYRDFRADTFAADAVERY